MTKNPYWIGCLLLCSLIATFTTAKADTIHEAAVDGDVERVEQLLIGGADVNAPDADDEGTPLQWAMFTNQTNVVRLLLEYGANPNIDGPLGTPLQVAISRGNSEMFQLLLDHGADPNRGVGSTPLYTATQKGSLEVVELLLARGADPTLATDDGTTPLHAAAKRGELEIAQRLVDHGADVNTLDAIGRPAIHFAMGTQHGAVAAYLRKKGAAPGKIVPITDLLASGDLAQGELETEKNCGLGCHSLEKNKHEHGPSLWNVVGRLKGSVKDFNYSPAFSTLGGTWTFEALNEFVARPTEVIPGIRLMEAGITDPQTRANIIAYLRTLSDNPKPLP